MPTRLLLSVLCGTVLAFVVGCSTAQKGSEPMALGGSAWRLIAWNVADLDPSDFEITMEIDGDRVAGKAAVNRYFGPVEHDLDGTFRVGLVGSTMMAGPEPAMRAEQAFTRMLPEARRWATVNDELRLFDEQGTQILSFKRAG